MDEHHVFTAVLFSLLLLFFSLFSGSQLNLDLISALLLNAARFAGAQTEA